MALSTIDERLFDECEDAFDFCMFHAERLINRSVRMASTPKHKSIDTEKKSNVPEKQIAKDDRLRFLFQF